MHTSSQSKCDLKVNTIGKFLQIIGSLILVYIYTAFHFPDFFLKLVCVFTLKGFNKMCRIFSGTKKNFTLCFAFFFWNWNIKELRFKNETDFEWFVLRCVPFSNDSLGGQYIELMLCFWIWWFFSRETDLKMIILWFFIMTFFFESAINCIYYTLRIQALCIIKSLNIIKENFITEVFWKHVRLHWARM